MQDLHFGIRSNWQTLGSHLINNLWRLSRRAQLQKDNHFLTLMLHNSSDRNEVLTMFYYQGKVLKHPE